MAQPHLKLDLAPHERLLGKYRLLAKLGEGGMGTVYLALASGFGAFRKLLVVKELRRDLPWRESSLAMFMDEAQLAARLDHPNVLQTFEAGEAEGRHFLAMEYLDGQPLSVVMERARRSGVLPLEMYVHIFCEVLNGLQYAHELSDFDGARLHVVHRDISPQNVFITYHGQVKVVDFGVAKANNSSSLTSPGMFKGKFAYAAPEQLLARPVDGRCDLFAVGVMLWEAMSGRRFSESTPSAPAFRTRSAGLEPRIRQLVPEADPQLSECCDRALQVEANDRFPTADAFRTQLENWLNSHGGHIQPAQLGQRMRELFSEERKVRHHMIEESMLEAGATQSVMQQLPLTDSVAEVLPPLRARNESGTAFRPPSRAASNTSGGERLEGQPQPGAARGSSAPPPLPGRGPGLFDTHTPSSSRSEFGTAAAANATGVEARAWLERLAWPKAWAVMPQLGPKPPWASAAILVALAVAVFITTYQLSSRVASGPSETVGHAATSGNAEPAPSRGPTLETAAPRPPAATTSEPAAAPPAPTTPLLADTSPRAPAGDGAPQEDVSLREPKSVESSATRSAAAQRAHASDGAAPLATKPASLKTSTRKESGSGRARTPVLRVRNDPGLGSDLRELRRSSAMRIDTEDPYQ